jgi:hypothetical protein
MEALLTDQLVQAIGAVLAVFILVVGTYLAKLAGEKLGVEVDTSRLQGLATAAEQGVLLAAQAHRKEPDSDGRNDRMHTTAIRHVKETAGRAAKKAGDAVVGAAVHAAVRKLKGLL